MTKSNEHVRLACLEIVKRRKHVFVKRCQQTTQNKKPLMSDKEKTLIQRMINLQPKIVIKKNFNYESGRFIHQDKDTEKTCTDGELNNTNNFHKQEDEDILIIDGLIFRWEY